MKFLAISLLIAIVGFSFFTMFRGWRNKLKSQTSFQKPLMVEPRDLGEMLLTTKAEYISTTFAHKPLERVVVHGLGVKNTCTFTIYDEGLLIERQPQDIFIPRKGIRDVTFSQGMIGKFLGNHKMLVIAWNLGKIKVESGFTLEAAQRKEGMSLPHIKSMIEGLLHE